MKKAKSKKQKAKKAKRLLGQSNTKRQALSSPVSPSPHHLLQQALALHQARQLPQAEALYRQILQAEPNHVAALHYLGILAHEAGKNEIAVELIRKAITLKPDYIEAHYNLGILLQVQGKLDEAAASFRQATTLLPEFAEAYNNLGIVQQALGKLEEAAASYRRVLALKPDYAPAHSNLGIVLQTQGKLDEAVASFRHAILLNPGYAAAHSNLGIAFKDQGKLDEAVASFQQALALQPDYVEVHYNLGIVLKAQGKTDEAAASLQHAISLKPDYAEAHNNLGSLLRDQGKLEEAIACYRQALKLKPDYSEVHSNLLFCLNYLPNQSISLYLEEARHYGRQVAAKVSKRFSNWTFSNNPDRLRIGMVSGDIRNHPVGYFLENMLAYLDPQKIKLFAFPTNRGSDELTGRIRSLFAAWLPLTDMDDKTAARLIHEEGVHVLLDLSGHTNLNRLPVFAWKPAPVQASWLGYFASTGIAEMDYVLADPVSVPSSHQDHFTERVWYLPETRLCFSPPVIDEELLATPLPALCNGYITLGCLQNPAKLNDEVLVVWGRILQKLPQAKLRLQHPQYNSPALRQEFQGRLARIGVGTDRVRFEEQSPRRQDYLAAHAHIDILLDTFPFPGGTTTCEAMWMGVPTVTLAGNSMLSRQGASLLACAGLTDWIADDVDDYVEKAVSQAADWQKLARLRADLRRQVSASPLFDGRRFAGNLEAALRGMWQQFREGWNGGMEK